MPLMVDMVLFVQVPLSAPQPSAGTRHMNMTEDVSPQWVFPSGTSGVPHL